MGDIASLFLAWLLRLRADVTWQEHIFMCWQIFSAMESLRSFAAKIKKMSMQPLQDTSQTSSPLPFWLPLEVVEVL